MTSVSTALTQKIQSAQKGRSRRPLTTRKPTGKPPWPIILLAGGEKAGKSYAAAQASASPHIGRTFWVGIGEDDPDEYGAIPGARFEIVQHDGTFWDIAQQIDAASAQPREDGKPNMLVIDSASRLWTMLSDEAQSLANRRRKQDSDTDAPIAMDLWNRATSRWETIMGLLRLHDGPVVITARLETVTVMDDEGKPTKDKQAKVKGQKGLPFDVGVVVQMPRRGETYITGTRSLRLDVGVGELRPVNNFTLEKTWEAMGLTGADATAPRNYSKADGAKSADESSYWIQKFNEARGDLTRLQALLKEARDAGLDPEFGMFAAIDAEIQHLEESAS